MMFIIFLKIILVHGCGKEKKKKHRAVGKSKTKSSIKLQNHISQKATKRDIRT